MLLDTHPASFYFEFYTAKTPTNLGPEHLRNKASRRKRQGKKTK